ncbi:hypothetical protein JHU04_002460 [Brenneria sp. 4F2]|nr:hypothetical protein [Brenneria bubanii]
MNKINELEEEIKSLKTELSATNLTISNIQNALNLPGKKGISLEVIDLVNELVAENAAQREAMEFSIAEDMWIENHDGSYEYQYVDWYVDVIKTALDGAKTASEIIAKTKAQAIMDAIDAMSDSGALTLGDAVIAMTAYSARLREGKA